MLEERSLMSGLLNGFVTGLPIPIPGQQHKNLTIERDQAWRASSDG
jgi:hypothetical protein